MELLLILLMTNYVLGWIFTLPLVFVFIDVGARSKAEALAEIRTIIAGVLLGTLGLVASEMYNR